MEQTISFAELSAKEQKIKDFVAKNNGEQFNIVYENGETETKKLFVSDYGNVCEFKKRSSRSGYRIPILNIASIEVKPKTPPIKVCRNNLRLVINYLSKSGFWTPMLNGAKYLISLSDEELESMRDWDTYHKVMNNDLREKGIAWFSMDCFSELFNKRLKTMRFESRYYKDFHERQILNAIETKTNYCPPKWANGYDCHFQIGFDKDMVRAWYSEEFRNCGNGHYYYLLDECHVLFGEDD
jgi:hypothetical protein